MKSAIVVDNTVVNLIVGSVAGSVEVPDDVNIGATWDGNAWVNPEVTISVVMYVVDFLNRFTSAERIAIRTSADPIVQDFVYLLDKYTTVDVMSTQMQEGKAYLVYTTLLTQERADAIFS